MTTNQKTIFNAFQSAFENNPNVSIAKQQTRVSFKPINSRLNYFILFCHQDGFYLHLNERRMKNEFLIEGFSKKCFNKAKKYQELEIRNINDAKHAIQLIKNNINFNQSI